MLRIKCLQNQLSHITKYVIYYLGTGKRPEAHLYRPGPEIYKAVMPVQTGIHLF
jgi:hypothetical protein